MEQELLLTSNAVAKILMLGIDIGRQNELERLGKQSKYLTQNKAWQLYGKPRVRGWVEAGLVKPIPSGGGCKSPKRYDRATLMALDASNTIVFRERKYIHAEKE